VISKDRSVDCGLNSREVVLLLCTVFRPALRPSKPPVQCVPQELSWAWGYPLISS